MQIKSLLLVAAAIVTVLGFTIPEGQPEGVYSVQSKENRTDLHTRIAEPYTGPITKRAFYFLNFEPDDARITCGHALNLDHTDTDAAGADIDRQCGSGALIVGGYNFYAIRGTTVSFVCNRSWDNEYCDARTRDQFDRVITEYCGSYNAGWVTIPYTGITYGYDIASSEFCGTGI